LECETGRTGTSKETLKTQLRGPQWVSFELSANSTVSSKERPAIVHAEGGLFALGRLGLGSQSGLAPLLEEELQDRSPSDPNNFAPLPSRSCLLWCSVMRITTICTNI